MADRIYLAYSMLNYSNGSEQEPLSRLLRTGWAAERLTSFLWAEEDCVWYGLYKFSVLLCP